MFPIKYFDTHLKLKDGVKLISRIWQPEGDGPWPALLMRQPYGREIASTLTYAHPTWWASKGYLVIIQDVRGQGGSEGIFQGFSQEANDTSETHEWVRTLEGCNGKLGLYGFSYQGLTQLTGKEFSTPPDCLSPAMTGLSIRDHWCCHGGAFFWHNNITWALQIAALKMKRDKNISGWEEIRSNLENKFYLRNGLELIKKFDPENFIIKWLNILEENKTFDEIIPVSSWLKKPMLIYGGLWDPHLRGSFDLYQKSKDAGGDPEIIISNSSHINWWEESQYTLLNFFEKHLKKSDNQKNNVVKNKKIWNISQKNWDNIEDRSLSYEFGLISDGIANIETKDGSLSTNSKSLGFVSIVHDPWRPTSIDGGHLGPNPGIFNRKDIDKRLDVAIFQTNYLKENIHIFGIPILCTLVTSDKESFDICLALSLVDKDDDIVKQFSTGFFRVNKNPINQKKECTIEFQPTNITLPKGNKLRLSIAASAWPAIGVNTGCVNKNLNIVGFNHEITTLNFDLSKSIMKIKPFF